MKPLEDQQNYAEYYDRSKLHMAAKAKPFGSLGYLEEQACRLAGLQRSLHPKIGRTRLLLFAADHGITKAKPSVSAFPREVSISVFKTVARGMAASSVLCAANKCELELIDVGLDLEKELQEIIESPLAPCAADTSHITVHYSSRVRAGSRNMLEGPAMLPEECEAAMQAGAAAVLRAVLPQAEPLLQAGPPSSCPHSAVATPATEAAPVAIDRSVLLCLGELGIGNTTAAAALLAALTGAQPKDVCGRGTGVDDAGLLAKQEAVAAALEVNAQLIHNGGALGALQAVGGLELAAMTGACLQAEKLDIPVVADGFISGAAALAAVRHDSAVCRVLFLSHKSAEQGSAILNAALQGDAAVPPTKGCALPPPALDLDMRLGEGTGAVLMVPLLRAATSLMGMATLADALT